MPEGGGRIAGMTRMSEHLLSSDLLLLAETLRKRHTTVDK